MEVEDSIEKIRLTDGEFVREWLSSSFREEAHHTDELPDFVLRDAEIVLVRLHYDLVYKATQ